MRRLSPFLFLALVPTVAVAFDSSPSDTYAPAKVPCPPGLRIRSAAGGLSPNETAWLTGRRTSTIQPMTDFLRRANVSGFDAAAYMALVTSDPQDLANLPNIAIAVSGGGYRALMNGAGFLSAADSRTPESTAAGGIGGLLQASTYLAGLSGGGWLVGSLFVNGFVPVSDLQANGSVWQFQNSIFQGPSRGGLLGVVDTTTYWDDIQNQVSQKGAAGFETSITDYWGRALSYQLVGAPHGGPALVFSGIADLPAFQQAQTPFPLLVADGRAPGEKLVTANSTIFEFNPFEMGSFDPTVSAFAPLAYLGTNFTDGTPVGRSQCVRGFDQYGFVMGTSSSLFNAFLLQNYTASGLLPTLVVDALRAILGKIGKDDNDIAQYTPNPFYGWNPAGNPAAAATQLSLVDGGEDLQNLPLVPLIQPARAVDVIFAVDSSADTDSLWPNGTALAATYARSTLPIANGTLFPAVPDTNTMVNLGLNNRPTFFGCDAADATALAPGAPRPPPLLVYLPNAPYTTASNVSTFDPSYAPAQRDAIIANGFAGATQGRGALDPAWPACVACAALSRSLARTRTPPPPVCVACFARYCWNGTVRAAPPARAYQPDFKLHGSANSSDASAAAPPRRGVGPRQAAVAAFMGSVLGLHVLG
ncbi:hypothetical protein P8C59_008005 [Phyllachora maydis]|uniref:Lysophospholipase n=1 Tax=Phyllachora maydis TaxID=1825666 RepID=A0AAD9ME46_9PEZI|nr:hypothetical protein P8C59_008005 [Phyllachora maydis]